MKKVIKYSMFLVALAIVLYCSVTLAPLDQVRKSRMESEFNAKSYAGNFMSGQIETLPALEATEFLAGLEADPESYCSDKGRKLGISDEYNFIINGDATITSVEDESITVSLENGKEVKIATDFIFGNAIRDGSGMANIAEFQNTMDFNQISVELNNIVRETIVPPFRENAAPGMGLRFKGAVTVDIKSLIINNIRVIPLSIKLNN